MAAGLAQSIFDVTSAAGAQFFAMIIGAFLASTGGFFVAWLLDLMERKRQERSIALVVLDLLSSLNVLTSLANDAYGRGDPFGPFTIRLVCSCQRDLDIYERNRERIADIADPDVRAGIYEFMARMNLAIDGVLAETETIVTLQGAERSGTDAALQEIAERNTRRITSFEFLIDIARELSPPLIKKLRALAKTQEQNLAAIVAANRQSPPPPPA